LFRDDLTRFLIIFGQHTRLAVENSEKKNFDRTAAPEERGSSLKKRINSCSGNGKADSLNLKSSLLFARSITYNAKLIE
jgi:hypothetical protein